MNLLTETVREILKSGHTERDIAYIGSRDGYECSWAEFSRMANRDYDNGYGGQQVASDLEIVFKDGAVLRRGEYDGSEWWELLRPFVRPKATRPIKRLFVDGGWATLDEINKPSERSDDQG